MMMFSCFLSNSGKESFKLMVVALVIAFRAFYGNPKFIVMCAGICIKE
jgi:hypothetical protein